jgi:hypothetical protein
MPISKGQINWSGVSFSSTPIVRVSNAMFGQGGKLISFKGDADLYPSIMANVTNEPHASITTADVGPMMLIAPGASGSLVATMNDAKLVSLGGVVFTMTNAVFENADGSAAHQAFGSATGVWKAFASDGATAPLVITRV